MFTLVNRLSATLIALLASATVHAAENAPRAPDVPAKAWVLIDHDSGQVLAARNAEQRMPPASLTKLAVSYVLFQQLRDGKLKLGDRVSVSAHAAETKGASMFLRPGEKLGVEELLRGMIVVSANDATVALAEYVAGSEAAFIERMNTAVRALGLTNTHFAGTNGLPTTNHYSSARDLARLAAVLLREFPEYYSWFGIKELTHNGIRQFNRNALLWRDASADGIKTGHTREAGYCLAASARRGDMRLIALVLGAADENARVTAAQQLLNFGFNHYETRLLFRARATVAQLRVWMGNASVLALGPAQPLYLTLPRGWHERARVRIDVKQDQTAPIDAGQAIGALAVELDGEAIAQYPLVALSEVARGNVFQRAFDHVQLWFH